LRLDRGVPQGPGGAGGYPGVASQDQKF
jgi:hypothetical protein